MLHNISVIPLSHTLDTNPLTYRCNEDFFRQIRIGSLVEIPFGKSLEYGVVAFLQGGEYIGEDLKAVSQVICSTPLLAPYQIESMISMASLRYQPIHKIALFFLPKSLLSYFAKHTFFPLTGKKVKKRTSKRVLSFYRTGRVTPREIEDMLGEKRTVIIFPDDFLLSVFTGANHIPESDLLIVPANISTARRIRAWKSVYHGERTVVAGTRRLLFFHLSAYDQILYIEDAFSDMYFQFPERIRYLDFLDRFGSDSPNVTILSSTPSLYALTRLRTFQKSIISK